MHGDAARHPDADRGHLPVPRPGRTIAGEPHPAAALDPPRPGDAGLRARQDQGFLQRAHVGDHVDRLGELHDRVANELPGAVPGDLAAAVHVDHRDARVGQRPVHGAGPLARGVHRLVLKQQAGIADRVAHPLLVHLPLKLPGRQVGDRAVAEPGVREDEFAVHTASLLAAAARAGAGDLRLSWWRRAERPRN